MKETFLAEFYLPSTRSDVAAALAVAAQRAAEELSREGTGVSYVRLIFVPEDETCFLVYEAVDGAAVATAGSRAGLFFERVLVSEEHAESRKE